MPSQKEILSQISLALSYVLQNSIDLTDEQSLAVSSIYPAWHTGVKYKKGQKCNYEGKLYVCLNNHESAEGNDPSVNSADWSEVTVDPSTGYEIWVAPQSASNAYNYGDIVWYPDMEGQLYMSIKNNNKKEPTDEKSWQLYVQ